MKADGRRERQKLQFLTKALKDSPFLFWYKIPDTYGGRKKPFDVFMVYSGVPVAIEFKDQGELSTGQEKNLVDFYAAGGQAYIGDFEKGSKSVCFTHIISGARYFLICEKGQYTNIAETLLWLIKPGL